MTARKPFHCFTLLSAFLPLFITTSTASAAPPNIVLITADNLGYGDVGCYGNHTIKTPHIDRLAKQGVRCTDFYTASPTCTVSRATLLTGRYPQRIKLNNQLSSEENLGVGLRHSEHLIPEFLKPAGYATGCFGKWNIGFAPGSRPTERGFDEFFGHASGNIDYYTHVYNGRLDMFRGTEPARVEGYSTFLFADAACDFIKRKQEQPFFVYLPFNAPHFPQSRNKAPGVPTVWQTPPEYLEMYGYPADESDPKKRYQAVVSAMDAGVGRVLKQLDDLDLAENTLVIWYSDNGAFMLKDRGLEVASNKPFRDGGITLYEGGIRVPCVVRWPGHIEAGSTSQVPFISLDFAALITHVAGGSLPTGHMIDGKNPLSALQGKGPAPHETLYFQFRKYSALRRGRYKLFRADPKQAFQLYDLANDIGESTDIAAQRPKLTAELQQDYERWFAETDGSP